MVRLCGDLTVGWEKCAALLSSTIQASKNGGHLLRVLLLLLVLGPFRVLIRVLLCPITILLLDGEAVDIISVHDLFNALIVVKN